MLVGTTLELERQRLDPGDVYEGWTALNLPVLVPGHQSTVDGDPLAGIGVQVHDVAAQNVVEGARGFVGCTVGAVLVSRDGLPFHRPRRRHALLRQGRGGERHRHHHDRQDRHLFISLLLLGS